MATTGDRLVLLSSYLRTFWWTQRWGSLLWEMRQHHEYDRVSVCLWRLAIWGHCVASVLKNFCICEEAIGCRWNVEGRTGKSSKGHTQSVEKWSLYRRWLVAILGEKNYFEQTAFYVDDLRRLNVANIPIISWDKVDATKIRKGFSLTYFANYSSYRMSCIIESDAHWIYTLVDGLLNEKIL